MYAQVGNLNPYALDYPVCTEDSATQRGKSKFGRAQRTWFLNQQLEALYYGKSAIDGYSKEPLGLTNEEAQSRLKAVRKSLKLEPVEG